MTIPVRGRLAASTGGGSTGAAKASSSVAHATQELSELSRVWTRPTQRTPLHRGNAAGEGEADIAEAAEL